jgi:hypothetical protein
MPESKFQFTDAKFMTAKEKQLVLAGWESFLKSGCAKERFSHRLYEHLRLHCSFIAHYDRAGFYETYFVNGDDALHFLSQFDMSTLCESIEGGDTYWIRNGNDVSSQMYDINQAMVAVAAKYLPELKKKFSQAQRDADLHKANLLMAKHGVQVKELQPQKQQPLL